jgi:hypothetical protein
MTTRPGRQAPIGEMALKPGAGANFCDKNLSDEACKATKSLPLK